MSILETTITFILVIALFSCIAKLFWGEAVVDRIWRAIFSGNGKRGLFSYIVGFVWWFLPLPFRMLGFLFGRSSPNSAHGSAAWMEGLEKFFFFWRTKGLLIDGKKKRLSLERSYKNLILAAPTGGFKTSGYIVPNILALKDASATITDCSGEIFLNTAGQKQHEGYDIYVFSTLPPNKNNPVPDAEQSSMYNCLEYTKLPDEDQISITALKKVVDSLIAAQYPQPHGSEQFWLDGARGVLFTLLRCLVKEAEPFQNLANLRVLLAAFGCDGRDLNDFIARNADQAVFQDWMSFLAQDKKVILNILSTCKTILEPFADPMLAALTKTDTLHMRKLRERKTLLYVIVPEHEMGLSSNKFLLSMLYTQLFSYAMQQPRPGDLPLFFFMDEAGHYPVPQLPIIMSTIRKKRCSISLCIQDLAQLRHCYGEMNAQTIIHGGAQSKLYFPGLPLKTCEEIERTLGKATVQLNQKGMRKIGGETPMVRETQHGRSLLTAQEIRTLPDKRAIFVHGNKKPILLQLTPYFRQRRLRQMAAKSPPQLERSPLTAPPSVIIPKAASPVDTRVVIERC